MTSCGDDVVDVLDTPVVTGVPVCVAGERTHGHNHYGYGATDGEDDDMSGGGGGTSSESDVVVTDGGCDTTESDSDVVAGSRVERKNKKKKKVKKKKKIYWIKHRVKPDDTLAGICLRYDVEASLLKRLNRFTADHFWTKKCVRGGLCVWASFHSLV